MRKSRHDPVIRAALLLLFLFVAGTPPLMAEPTDSAAYKLDPIVVTGSHTPRRLSESANTMTVMTGEEIADLPVDNIAGALEYVNDVDVRQRGARGVQADVAIRGGGYEQTLILVDGIAMNAPQTGHHNMDLPVSLDDIERIEVVKGPAARIYGPNAMAGVINIITREAEENSVGGRAEAGEYGYFNLSAHKGLRWGDTSARLSAGRRYSSGYLGGKDTDFDIKTASFKGSYKKNGNTFRLGMGATDKAFGAYKFYSDVYPEQREKTEALLVYSNAELHMANLVILPRLHWRRHEDDYKININDTWSRNDHQTDSFGAQVKALISSGWGRISLGAEAQGNAMESSSLGDHDRSRQSLFLEHRIHPTEKLAVGIGASIVHYSQWGWEYWPGADLSLDLTERLTWFATIEKSFRVPTYTELYYSTPANQGHPELDPEKAWTGETGWRWRQEAITAHFSLFYRDLDNAIDWFRKPGESAWRATNLAAVETQGAEAGFTLYPASFLDTRRFASAALTYTFLDSDRSAPDTMASKYALDHLEHQLTGSLVMQWSPRVKQVIKVRCGRRLAGDSYTVTDTRLTWSISDYRFFLEAANLFDTHYVESGFAPMPGRWVTAGVSFDWR
ncbi:MAG: TonB-dependent receptor plug domain-containing protein [Thermodesulfobacteriota bacterium]